MRIECVSQNSYILLRFSGWRSWNCYHGSVTQAKMEIIMEKMAQRTRKVGGVKKSLIDVGYVRVGLDDGWQV